MNSLLNINPCELNDLDYLRLPFLFTAGAEGGLDCSTTICHRYTPPEDLLHYLSTADIVVSAAGVPNLIRGEHLKPGCCVVDVAINRVKNKETGKMKLVGDCHFDCE